MSAAANASNYEAPTHEIRGDKDLTLKPKVRPLPDDALLVTLPCGATKTIRKTGNAYAIEGEFNLGRPVTFADLRHAIEHCARATEVRFAPLDLSIEQVRALATEAEESRDAACKILRDLLRRRTGRDWSVKGSRGTAYSWISISAPPRRRGEFGSMGVEDQIVLFAALGEWAHQDISIRPCGGVRGAYVFRAAGLPVPDDWRINAPSWD